jgi:AAA family ATP:ADP antiporter
VPFILFFGLFAYVLHPHSEYFHGLMAGPVSFLHEVLPAGFGKMIGALHYWTFSLFYVCAELWGSFILSLLFWGFANDITRVHEAKRFYGLFGLGANVALLAIGPTFNCITSFQKQGLLNWQGTIEVLMTLVVICGLVIMGIYRWMNRHVLNDPRFYSAAEQQQLKKAKPKMPLMASLAYLARSRYILCIAILVLAYGVAINLIEVTWKSQLRLLFPDKNDYLHFMGQYSFYLGFTTIFMMLFVSSNVLRRFGWGVAAQITPVVLLISGVGFFAFVLYGNHMQGFLATWGTTPLVVAIFIGAFQNVFSKACKYSLFDPTKEMAYIPLDQESKVQGKAAIDTVGARLGKAGGSGIQILLIGMLGNLTAATEWIAGILFVIIGIWIWAVVQLKRDFKE